MKYKVYICPPDVPLPGPCRGRPNTGWPSDVAERVAACPYEAEHSYGPTSMLAAMGWWDETTKHWKQLLCQCGLYLIVVPRAGSRRPPADQLISRGYRPDGTWSCTGPRPRRTPCRECVACKAIMGGAR